MHKLEDKLYEIERILRIV